MEMKPESILALFASCTAQQRASFSSQIIEGIDNGYADPIMIISAVKNLYAILEDIESFAKPYVINELEKNGGKLELYGISFLKKEAGTKYDFSQTKDPIHEYLALSFESIKKTIKDREDFLKSLPVDGQLITDEDTGDVYKIYRPIKTSTTTFSASLSK
jgi:hypothetical protein